MITITPDVNLGNVIVTTAIGIVGLGLRKFYKLISEAIEKQEQALCDIDDHAEVINLHTGVMIEGGLVKGPIGIPRVEERRRKARIYQGHGA